LLAILVAIVVIIVVIIIVIAVLAAIAAIIGWVALGILAALLVGAMLLTFLIRDGLGTLRAAPPGTKPKKTFDADDATTTDQYPGTTATSSRRSAVRMSPVVSSARSSASSPSRMPRATSSAGVQLPSTQNWSPMNGDGALNDLSADAMLALFPGLETQYKKAVWDASSRRARSPATRRSCSPGGAWAA
jgi:hypothetical protein